MKIEINILLFQTRFLSCKAKFKLLPPSRAIYKFWFGRKMSHDKRKYLLVYDMGQLIRNKQLDICVFSYKRLQACQRGYTYVYRLRKQ